MKNTTLCYIENERGDYLMLHRVKKENGGVRPARDAGGDGADAH